MCFFPSISDGHEILSASRLAAQSALESEEEKKKNKNKKKYFPNQKGPNNSRSNKQDFLPEAYFSAKEIKSQNKKKEDNEECCLCCYVFCSDFGDCCGDICDCDGDCGDCDFD